MSDLTTTAPGATGPVHRRVQAARLLGMSCPTFKRLEKSDPHFPQGIQLSERIRVYREADLLAYLQRKQAECALHAPWVRHST